MFKLERERERERERFMGNRTEDASWSENVKNVEMTFPPAGFGFSFVLFGCLFYVVVLVCVWFVCLFFINIYHIKARRPVDQHFDSGLGERRSGWH